MGNNIKSKNLNENTAKFLGKLINHETSKDLEVILKQLKQIKPQSDFEKLPKNILAEIMSFLEPKEISNMWRLNKFFFSLITDSTCSIILWRKICCRFYDDQTSQELHLENNIDQFLVNIILTPFEEKLNRYCLFFKHFFKVHWDPK